MVLVALAVLGASSGTAGAATCAFDEATGILTVDLTDTAAALAASPAAIRLDGVPCGAATRTSTSRIVVNGYPAGRDNLILRGKFAPGRNDVPETDDPEIEIELVGWQDRLDRLTIIGSEAADVWRFSAGGINLNGDLDDDLTAPAAGRITLRPDDGDDVVDCSAYIGAAHLRIFGAAGADTLTGGPGPDTLWGQAGNDSLFGGPGNDNLQDGRGADLVQGGPGDDIMSTGNVAVFPDGADDYRGGDGFDYVSYNGRQADLVVTIDDLADDGEPGENDNVHLDVEGLMGGLGADVLVGSSADNHIEGRSGDEGGFDEIYGGGGDDDLSCVDGNGCLIVGDEGDDWIIGSYRNDELDGGPGDDLIGGQNGDDTLTGGDGVDDLDGGNGNDVIFNADAFADTVDCGFNTDDAEPDPLDTFIGCENI